MTTEARDVVKAYRLLRMYTMKSLKHHYLVNISLRNQSNPVHTELKEWNAGPNAINMLVVKADVNLPDPKHILLAKNQIDK